MPNENKEPSEALAESGMFQTAAAATARELRERAQAQVRERAPKIPQDFSALSADAVRKLLHELSVHQIELELQNEELRRAQEELEGSRARYFDLYDLAPVGYLTIGETGLVVDANLTAAGLLDVARSALIKQPWTRFVFFDDQDTYFLHRKQVMLSRAPHGCELRLVKKTGEPFWARLEARTAQGSDDIRVALSDISLRKRAEGTLRASEARYRVLFASSPNALLTLAPPSWSFTSANEAAVTMFGARNEADFISQLPRCCSPERQLDGWLSEDKARSMIALAMQNGSHSYEWTYLRPPAGEFRATVTLARMEANGMPLLEATVRDDTEAQKRRAITAQTERLASMGLLAASVGHEINNPLAYVLSNLETLTEVLPKIASACERSRMLREVAGEEASHQVVGEDAGFLEPAILAAATQHALDALEGAQRITRISGVLSAFSRVDTAELRTVDLHLAVDSAISMASNEIRSRATLIKDFAPTLPAVWASSGKLSQVFLNLLINSAHAIAECRLAEHRIAEHQPAEHSITVRTWSEGSHVFAEVRDTGTGIAPENIAQVFEPFFSTKEIGSGSGLGLSICRSILAEFGGDIRLESEVGIGTCITVLLFAGVEPPQARGSETLLRVSAPSSERGRILVVDDEEPLRRVMTRLLIEHEVVTAASGAEARAILEIDQAFDVILCDLMMPQVSGVDLHRWLTAHNPPLARRLVFVTGGAFGLVATQYLADSSNLKIKKPFDSAELARVVSKQMEKAKSEPPLGSRGQGHRNAK